MDPNSPEAQAELTRRHKAAATTVLGLVVATILLSIVAYLGRPYFTEQPPNPPLDFAVRIVILVLGLGAVVWRRTKFQPARLKDIAGLDGVSGLVRTIEKTTLQVALLGAAIAVTGFVTTLITGNELYTFWSGAIAIVVLVYGYPTKSSWLRTVSRYTDPQADVPPPPSSPEAV
ncbi:MAG TPA: hypothetical protein VHH35_17475 [Pyrinomonadaceae bacterium]|nr:hypothetical protein [Pyrinomonadaceae bacterium]